nr:MAG TPA: hypothetical protein [Bacteriophage sp.]
MIICTSVKHVKFYITFIFHLISFSLFFIVFTPFYKIE